MKATQAFLALIAVLLFAVSAASAPKQNVETVKYDVATETTLKGTVEEIKEFDCPVSGTVGTHLELRTSDGLVEVHLAPAAFLKDFGIVINQGDKVEVIGSKVQLNGTATILARQVTSNSGIYTFRNPQGRPLW